MFSKKKSLEEISGDYQFRALSSGQKSQRQWHQEKIDAVMHALKGRTFKRALDAGCGSGVICAEIARFHSAMKVVGCDVNNESIRFATNHYRNLENLEFVKYDLLGANSGEDAAMDQPADLVVSTEVIEHFAMPDVSSYLKTIHRLGSDDCVYLFTTPDYASLWPVVEFGLDFLGLTPRLKGHQHLSKFNQRNLTEVLEEHGFKAISWRRICGVGTLLTSLSPPLARRVSGFEHQRGSGMLLMVVARKA